MKILIYNWAPLDSTRRGGGVNVYTRNLISKFNSIYPSFEIYYLCAGIYYDSDNTEIRIEEVDFRFEANCRTFAIINSPVFSPAFLSFYHVYDVMYDKELKRIIERFINEYSFDVIHFQNLEGLSFSVLETKKNHPHTKYILSLHNYYVFCPQVNLWEKDARCCGENNTGAKCIDCMSVHVPREKLVRKLSLTYDLQKYYSEEKEEEYNKAGIELDKQYEEEERRELFLSEKENLEKDLKLYRNKFVDLINENIDEVLAVSERVKEIAIDKGIRQEKIRVAYIGTLVAEKAKNELVPKKNDSFVILYMGYQRADKGFFFLVDALNDLDIAVSKRITLILAAKGTSSDELRWNIVRDHFHDIVYQNGYTSKEMENLINSADLGIIPVLWEDNLPQVAIEMVAGGVPILCSDKGGAHEISSNTNFVFKAGDKEDFHDKLTQLIENSALLPSFFGEGYKGLTTMQEHIEELVQVIY